MLGKVLSRHLGLYPPLWTPLILNCFEKFLW
jgi:hypothetical protein